VLGSPASPEWGSLASLKQLRVLKQKAPVFGALKIKN